MTTIKSNSNTKEKVEEISNKIEKGILDAVKSDNYKSYLKTMSKFHRYSVNNSVLIHAQNKDATMVAGYKSWEENFNRKVKKGEKGIQIFIPYKSKYKNETAKLDKDKRPIFDNNGKAIMEETEIEKINFRVSYVFDVSQTEGEPIPNLSIAKELESDVKNYNFLFEKIKNLTLFNVGFEKIENGAKGFCNITRNKIVINEGMSELQNLKTLVHEVAHSKLHNEIESCEDLKSSGQKEVEAESIAFVICNYLGLDTSEYSFPYLASWSSGKDLKELKSSLDLIRKTSLTFITEIENFNKEKIVEKSKSTNTINEKINKIKKELNNKNNVNVVEKNSKKYKGVER